MDACFAMDKCLAGGHAGAGSLAERHPPAPAVSTRRRITLAELPVGSHATVVQVHSAAVDPMLLRRLGEIGFVPGEPLQLRHRGPGGREPLAVQIGETMFALRLAEARCIEVQLDAEPERG